MSIESDFIKCSQNVMWCWNSCLNVIYHKHSVVFMVLWDHRHLSFICCCSYSIVILGNGDVFLTVYILFQVFRASFSGHSEGFGMLELWWYGIGLYLLKVGVEWVESVLLHCMLNIERTLWEGKSGLCV